MVKFKIGEVIAEGTPFTHCVDKGGKETRCHYCLKMRPLKNCSKCRVAKYCSIECQKIDWKNVHRSECEIFKKDSSSSEPFLFDFNNLRLVLRCMLILDKNPSKADELVDTFKGPRSFSSMKSNVENIFGTTNNISMLSLEFARVLRSLGLNFDMNNYKELYGRVVMNINGIGDGLLMCVGHGIFISGSVFDHSCKPNTYIDFDGLKLQARAMKAFDSEKEPPVVSFIDSNLPKERRQELLSKAYFFTCKCARCMNPDDPELESNLMKSRLDYNFFKLKQQFMR